MSLTAVVLLIVNTQTHQKNFYKNKFRFYDALRAMRTKVNEVQLKFSAKNAKRPQWPTEKKEPEKRKPNILFACSTCKAVSLSNFHLNRNKTF